MDVGPLSLATINMEGQWMPILTMPEISVAASDINLVKDEFNHFTMVNEELKFNGEIQTYRIKDGEGNFAFANGKNLTLRVGELESYGSSSEGNGKVLSTVYELIDWNNSMRIREGGLASSSYHLESGNLGFENLILVQNEEDSYGYIIRYEPEDHRDKKDDLSGYAGIMMIKDLKGNTTKIITLKNGEVTINENAEYSAQYNWDIWFTKVTTPFGKSVKLEIYGATVDFGS